MGFCSNSGKVNFLSKSESRLITPSFSATQLFNKYVNISLGNCYGLVCLSFYTVDPADPGADNIGVWTLGRNAADI